MIYWTTCFYQRQGIISVIDEYSGNLFVIVVSFQESVITQPWYTCGMQDFRPPQKISLFYIWLIKAEFEWTGHSVEKEELEKQKLKFILIPALLFLLLLKDHDTASFFRTRCFLLLSSLNVFTLPEIYPEFVPIFSFSYFLNFISLLNKPLRCSSKVWAHQLKSCLPVMLFFSGNWGWIDFDRAQDYLATLTIVISPLYLYMVYSLLLPHSISHTDCFQSVLSSHR